MKNHKNEWKFIYFFQFLSFATKLHTEINHKWKEKNNEKSSALKF